MKKLLKILIPILLLTGILFFFLHSAASNKPQPQSQENPVSSQVTASSQKSESSQTESSSQKTEKEYTAYYFRNSKLKNQHYEKHGKSMGFANRDEYEKAASRVINNENALYKEEKEDGDGVYYIESTNEFVVLSTDGYIRTYFLPSGGKAYFERQ